jgi:hypothetical protein
MTIEELLDKLQDKYDLTYRCKVNLEGTTNNMLYYGLTLEQCEDIIMDIYDNEEVCGVCDEV